MPRINHFIVLLLENRSFDHLFGFFPPPAGEKIENLLARDSLPVNLLDPTKPASAGNPSFEASQPAPFAVHDKDGPSHSFNSVNVQLTNNKSGPSDTVPIQNNGFARSYADNLKPRLRVVDHEHVEEVMQSFSPDQLPSLNQLAQEFCLCDHWHCEVPGPTMPNRMFMHAATSEGYIHNDFKRPYTSKTVYELFEEKGLTWAIYFHDLHDLLQFHKLEPTTDHFRRFDRWAADVAAGTLLHYTFLFPRFLNARSADGALFANSQHAPEDVRFADHLIADVYDALAANPELFRESALVITYDEHGGFFDHVLPGPAPNPDGQNSPNPDDRATFKIPAFAFDRIGLRVPAVIVSPWIAKGGVEHRMLQHTSVIKTVSEMFGLNGPLNRRDESAQSFADLFEIADQPRSADDIPRTLNRAPLEDTVESVVAGVPLHPADEPLDELTKDWTMGMLSLLGGGLEGVEGVEEAPSTQGEASATVEARLRAAGL